jgi:hypothetical protein
MSLYEFYKVALYRVAFRPLRVPVVVWYLLTRCMVHMYLPAIVLNSTKSQPRLLQAVYAGLLRTNGSQ